MKVLTCKSCNSPYPMKIVSSCVDLGILKCVCVCSHCAELIVLDVPAKIIDAIKQPPKFDITKCESGKCKDWCGLC